MGNVEGKAQADSAPKTSRPFGGFAPDVLAFEPTTASNQTENPVHLKVPKTRETLSLQAYK